MASTAGSSTAPQTTGTAPAASSTGWVASNGKWLAGYAAFWLLLEGMVEAGAGELAAGIAVLAVGSSFIIWGPDAIANLNKLVGK